MRFGRYHAAQLPTHMLRFVIHSDTQLLCATVVKTPVLQYPYHSPLSKSKECEKQDWSSLDESGVVVVVLCARLQTSKAELCRVH